MSQDRRVRYGCAGFSPVAHARPRAARAPAHRRRRPATAVLAPARRNARPAIARRGRPRWPPVRWPRRPEPVACGVWCAARMQGPRRPRTGLGGPQYRGLAARHRAAAQSTIIRRRRARRPF